MSLANRAYRNVFRKAARTLIVVLALGFSIAAIMSVYTGIDASNENTQEMIDDFEKTILELGELSETQERLITVGGGRGFPGGGGSGGGFGGINPSEQIPITEEVIENITSLEYVDAVFPLITNNVGDFDFEEVGKQIRESGLRPGDEGFVGIDSYWDYIIQGIPLNPELDEEYSTMPSTLLDGRKLVEGDEKSVMISEELVDFFNNAGVGAYIELQGTLFQVVGVYTSDSNLKNVYMGLEDAKEILGEELTGYSNLNIYAESHEAVDIVVYDIQQLYPDINVMSYEDTNELISDRMSDRQEEEIAGLEQQSQEIEDSGNQIIIISVVTAGLIVLFLMLYTVKERTKEIGILKSLGFPGSNIMSQFMIEGIIIGIIGGIFGIAIGVAGGPFLAELLLPETEVLATSIPGIDLIIITLVLTAVLGAAGTLYPAWEASRKNPVEAMRHE
jgi:ABC-type antimicrobial peptide transport system permease subunit